MSEALEQPLALAVVQVSYELGLPEQYLLPVTLGTGQFVDALEDPTLARYLLGLVRESQGRQI